MADGDEAILRSSVPRDQRSTRRTRRRASTSAPPRGRPASRDVVPGRGRRAPGPRPRRRRRAVRSLRRRRRPLLLATITALVVGPALAAFAHPLGNFTRNVFVGVVVAPERVDVVVRLDLAELPTLQERQRWDADGDGDFDDEEITAFAGDACPAALDAVEIDLADRPLPRAALERVTSRLDEGEAGLKTLLVTCRGGLDLAPTLAARTADGPVELVVVSRVDQDRRGWRELVVAGVDGVVVAGEDVRTTSASAALLAYPDETTVLDERTAIASLDVDLDAESVPPAWLDGDDGDGDEVQRDVDRDLAGGGWLEDVTGRFTDLVAERQLTAGFVAVAVGLALVLGAGHALAPGHGKTVMAAYVVGQRGTFRHALGIAGVVAVTHTLGVLGLGLVLTAGEEIVPEDLYPWFGTVSGLLLIAVGADLLRRAVRSRRSAAAGMARHDHVHEHGHDHAEDVAPVPARHDHEAAAHDAARSVHSHPHGPGHGHGHVADGWVVHDHGGGAHAHPLPGAALEPRTIVAMGLAGGLVPSPSALLVLLGAIAIGRTSFGVVLVVAYGLGLAITLVGGGLLLVRFRLGAERLLAHRPGGRLARLAAVTPLLTAVAVLLGGLVVIARSLLA